MANKTISGIRGYLMTQLSGLLPATDAYPARTGKLRDLKQGRGFTFSGFPACQFFSSGYTEELKDQRNQWRTYHFTIRVFMKETGDNKSDIEGLVEDAMEAVMNAVDADYTLGGCADNAKINVGEVAHVQAPFGIAVVMEMHLEAQVVIFY